MTNPNSKPPAPGPLAQSENRRCSHLQLIGTIIRLAVKRTFLPAKLWLSCLAIACLPVVALADHCPEEKMAAGEPENTLAGANLQRDKIQDVLARLGTPGSRDERTPVDYPPGSGWATYTWKRGEATITISTEFYTTKSGARVESMEVIELSGHPSDQASGTGRGLRLGDRLERAAKLYGARYVSGTVNGPTLGPGTITYCFSDESELSLGFDPSGKVVAMRLATSAE